MIQNRITTVTCSQPSISKWWWSGAIRKIRRPVPVSLLVTLKKPTWSITESVSRTNSPPRMSSSSSVRVRIASPASGAAERQRAGVAHEDRGRRGVPPQEAEAGAGDRGRDHREVERVADLVARLVAASRLRRAGLVVLPDVHQHVGAEDHHRGAGGEPVEAVGEVHAVAGRR